MATEISDSPADSEMTLSSSPRRYSKGRKPCHRASKKTSASLLNDCGGPIIDCRQKRVWKACDRCRVRKTKCDGEFPCKRCKDDDMVCTTAGRKRIALRQVPRGYVELLENTQYTLITAVQKLYTMIQNREPWDFGEPELNNRGEVTIHSIAEKLGCIRPSSDLSYAFLDDPEEFPELQALMEMNLRYDMESNQSMGSVSLPQPTRMDRASSSESDNSNLLEDPMKITLGQQQQQPHQHHPSSPYSSDSKSSTTAQSQTYRNNTPFNSWCGSDDLLSPAHMLDLTALYMQQQQLLSAGSATAATRAAPKSIDPANFLRPAGGVNLSTFFDVADGTVRPHMLQRGSGYDPADQGDGGTFDQYEHKDFDIKGAGHCRSTQLFA